MASSQDGQSRRRAMTSSRGLQCFNAILLLNIILLAAAVPSPSSALHSPEPSRCRHGEMRQAAEPQRGGHLKRHSQSILRGGGAVGGGGQGNAESASEAAACLPRMRPSRVPSMMMRSWSQRSLISSTTPAPEGESISNNNNNNNNNNNDASTGAGTQPEKLGVSPAGSGKKMAYWQLIRKALDLAWPSGHAGLQARVFLSLALIAWSRFTNMMIPQLYKAAVDDLSLPQGTSPVDPGKRGALWYICAYVATKAFVGLQGDVKSLIFTPVAQYVKRHVQLTVFDHLHSLSHRYHLGRKTGTVMQEMERGAGSLLRLVELVAFRVVPSLLDIGVCIAVFLASGRMKLAGITMVTIVLYLTTTAVVTEWRNSFRKNMVDAESRTKGRAVESLLNFETVKYFGAARHESTEYNRRMLEEQKAEMASERSLVLLNGLQQLIICGGLFASMMESALRVRSGQSSLGDFVMVNSYFLQLYAPLTWMGTIYRMIQQAFVDMERMLALLDEKVDIKDAPDAEPLAADGHGRVTFEGVSLAYDDDNYVLRNVTFEAGPGSKVALVGSSGAGKSSVGKLLCRLYDPTEGRVMIDGKDIKLTTLDSLRDTVGVVPQDCALFQDSIRYNIAYGRYTGAPASEPEVESACRSAMIHDKISSFPNGYQTLVGERGMRLSGGERQRVAVARVLLKSPKVLLLDEATSALDSETEGKIQASLESACLGRTTLVIAHRLSTIVDSDLILVMENGEIVERGRHGELVELGGRYAAMWAKQNSNRTAATSGASATLDHVPTAASTAEGDVEDDKTAVPSSGKPSPSPDGAPPKILRGGGGGGPVRVLSVRGGGDDAGAAAGKLAWIKSIGPMDGSRGGEEVMAMYKTADSCCFPEVVSSAAVHPPSYPRPVMHEHVRGRLAAEDGRFLLAGFSGAVDNIDHHGEIKPDAGACVYMRSPHVLVGGDRVAYIELLVGKGQDGKERAGALLKEAEGQAKEEGCTRMRVFVSGSARVLLTWLAQRGYLPVQRLRRWDGERSQNSQGEAIGPQEEAWMLLGSQHFPKESSGGVCGDVLWEMDKPLVSGEDADGEGPKDCSKEMSHVLDKEAWEDATVLRPLVRDERDATRQAKQAMWRPPVNGSLNIASFQKPSFQGFSLKHGASTPWNIGQETVAHQVTLDWAMGRSSWGRTLERRGILHRRDASLAARAQSHAAGSASVVQKGKQATLDCFFKVRSGEDGSNGVQEQHGEAGIDHHPGDGRQSGHAVDNVEPGEGLLAGRPAPVPSDPVASAPESQTAADMMVDAAAD